MKRLLTLLVLLYSLTGSAQVATYTFTNADPGNQTAKAVTSKDANITASDITRGTGTTAVAATGSINASGWVSTTQDANDYYEFTLTPVAGYQLNLVATAISVRRSGSGPINYLVAYSVGGGSETPITSGTIAAATTTDVAINASLSISTTQPIRFRIYAWGASSSVGTFRLNNSLTVSGATPLPVKFISFTGQSVDKAIVLNWSTSWEVRNAGFDILRSSTITNFEKVGFVAGHTTTQQSSVYSFIDTNVNNDQLYYYQLRQRNEDGSSELSSIIAARVRSDLRLDESVAVVYPNPNQGSFTLSTKGVDAENISFYTSTGNEIPITVSREQGSAILSIRANIPVSTGIYHLRLQSADGRYRHSLKIIIQ